MFDCKMGEIRSNKFIGPRQYSWLVTNIIDLLQYGVGATYRAGTDYHTVALRCFEKIKLLNLSLKKRFNCIQVFSKKC